MVVTRRGTFNNSTGEKTAHTRRKASNRKKNQILTMCGEMHQSVCQMLKEGWAIITEPTRCSWFPIPILLLFGEICLNVGIIRSRSYTEIDWKAYMQVG